MITHDTNDNNFVNVSEDGSHVFFTSPSQYNGEGEAGKAQSLRLVSGGSKASSTSLRLPHAISTTTGQTVEAGLTNWTRSIVTPPIYKAMDHSRSTPDGEAFAFESSAPPPGFDNTEANADDCGTFFKGKQPCTEVYLYDVRDDELNCVSCGPGGGPATGEARLQSITRNALAKVEPTNALILVHSLTDDGEELFFETGEGLVPRDQNETKDVYRWKKGAGLALISTGQSLNESALWGVTPNGVQRLLRNPPAAPPAGRKWLDHQVLRRSCGRRLPAAGSNGHRAVQQRRLPGPGERHSGRTAALELLDKWRRRLQRQAQVRQGPATRRDSMARNCACRASTTNVTTRRHRAQGSYGGAGR